MTTTPKEGPPTIRECLDMVVYLRRGLMTLNDRTNHDSLSTDKENEQKLFETGKAWISDADDYVGRLKPYAIDEALDLDEKRRAALERVVSVSRIRRRMSNDDRNYTMKQYDEAEQMIDEAIEALDALTPAPQEKNMA